MLLRKHKEFAIYPKSNGKPSQEFNQEKDMIRFIILKYLPGYFGEKVLNRLNIQLQNT